MCPIARGSTRAALPHFEERGDSAASSPVSKGSADQEGDGRAGLTMCAMGGRPRGQRIGSRAVPGVESKSASGAPPKFAMRSSTLWFTRLPRASCCLRAPERYSSKAQGTRSWSRYQGVVKTRSRKRHRHVQPTLIFLILLVPHECSVKWRMPREELFECLKRWHVAGNFNHLLMARDDCSHGHF